MLCYVVLCYLSARNTVVLCNPTRTGTGTDAGGSVAVLESDVPSLLRS